jgi:hypothetical protein
MKILVPPRLPSVLKIFICKWGLPTVRDCTTLTLVDAVQGESASLTTENSVSGVEVKTVHESEGSIASVPNHEKWSHEAIVARSNRPEPMQNELRRIQCIIRALTFCRSVGVTIQLCRLQSKNRCLLIPKCLEYRNGCWVFRRIHSRK